jgi:glycerate 2-kinase
MKNLKDGLFQIIDSAIKSVKPDQLIPRKVILEGGYLVIDSSKFDLNRFEKIYVVGTGKASATMAFELEKLIGTKICNGIVSTKYGHSTPCNKIRIIESGHPVLDENGLRAGDEILKLVSEADENDLVICLLSGGGSSLLEKLPDEITLSELQIVFRALLKCGANIEEMNIVRRHLSKIKGGLLAEAIYPATSVSLILSDVINDPLEAISGGVTSPDPSTFQDALNIIAKYKIKDQIPENVLKYISMGTQGRISETIKTGNKIFEKVTNIILGNNKEALIIAKEKAESLGFNVLIHSDNIQGEARDIGKLAANIAKEIFKKNLPISKPACVLIGGETTVKIVGAGKGGRNQELVLSAMIEMNDSEFNYIIASCGTDGTDGPTDAAGAIASKEIWQRSKELDISPLPFLQNNDSYTFFEKTGGLIITGPTGTNVMDIIIILVN